MPFSQAWNWLFVNSPTIFWFIVFGLVVALVVWRLAKFHIECKHCREVCDNDKGVKKDVSRLTDKVNTLLSLLSEKEIINSDFVSANSPLSLTAKGKELVKNSGWEKALEDADNKQNLFLLVDKLKLKSKADIEKYCLVILHELNSQRTSNAFTPVKKYLYENSNISEADAIFTCALYLRNMYFKEKPDIKE